MEIVPGTCTSLVDRHVVGGVDDDVGVIGSPNVDMRSFFLNFELGVFLYARSRIEALADGFLEDLGNSEAVDPVRFARRSRPLQLLEDTCRIFSPLF